MVLIFFLSFEFIIFREIPPPFGVLGIKTLYYQNTYDGKGEEDFLSLVDKNTDELLEWLGNRDELYDECETCKI